MPLAIPANGNPYGLPAYCYADLPAVPGVIIMVKFGEVGYWPTPFTPERADNLNAKLGVTHAIREAMQMASCFGWHVPGADPKHYPQARSLREMAEVRR